MKSAIWVLLLASSSILFSLALACATPFAALAAISGTRMKWRDAIAVVVLTWLVNQSIGYMILGYPRTLESFGWGVSIGVAALLALASAQAISARLESGWMKMSAAFLAAFGAYESALILSTVILPSSGDTFSPGVVSQIFSINILALAGLLLSHHIAIKIGLVSPETDRMAAARG